MIGESLGNYRVVDIIGQGGMGVVYLAEHNLIGKKAAVKVLLPQFSREPEIVNRFFNEAKATTLIKHPGIVETYDFGYHASGSAFIVMEYLDGESLAARIRAGGALPEDFIVDVARQVASAVHSAHHKGIVHRDLKSDNVFLVEDADMPFGLRAKVLDFGIAKLQGDTDPSLRTRAGEVMGSPPYMSPEQCKGAGRVDHRSDLYSLGCVIFEAACGQPPFLGESPGEIMASHILQQPPALMGVSDELAALVARLLRKNPDERPQSFVEVMRTLDAMGARNATGRQAIPLLRAQTPPQPTSTTLGGAASEMGDFVDEVPRNRGWMVPVAVTFMAIGVAAISLAVVRTRAPKPAPPPVAAAPPPAPAVARPAPVVAPPPPAPARVRLAIESTPRGAEVFRLVDGARVGVTPFASEREKSDGEVVYVLKLKGYHDERVELPADRDITRVIELSKKSDSRPAKTDKKTRVRNGVLDPF